MNGTSLELTKKEKELVKTFLRALCSVHEVHFSLFEDNVNERDVCSHLMSNIEYLKNDMWFSNYFVDIEYNRMLGGGPKMIYDERTGQDIIIIPDLVIHGRGRIDKHENLLCAEIKKSNSHKQEKEDDLRRLVFLTKRAISIRNKHNYVYGYLVGIYYEYNSYNSRSKIKIFKNGHCVQTLICGFEDLYNVVEEI